MQIAKIERQISILFLELGVCMRRVGDDDDVNDDVNDDDGEFVRVTFT